MVYKLNYFNAKGRGECIRYMFAYKQQPFEDVRVNREDWPALKASAPAGQMPFLEVSKDVCCGGNKDETCRISQSKTIARFVGAELELNGKDNWENAKLDEAVDLCEDLMAAARPLFLEQDPLKKAEIQSKLAKETLPPLISTLIGLTGVADKKFILGDKPAWADFFIGSVLEFSDNLIFCGKLAAVNANAKAYYKRIQELPGVAEWIAKRPDTPF